MVSLKVLLLVVVAAMAVKGSLAQSTPSCGSNLVPCASYLNSTNPPDTCCNPLKEAVKDELSCLCAIFNSPEILKSVGITREEGLKLAANCGVDSGNLCGSVGAPTATTIPTPPTPGGRNNAMHGTSWMGMTGFISLFLFWWCISF